MSTGHPVPRHGAIGFAGATISVLVGTLAASVSFRYFLLYIYFVPLIVADLIVAVVLAMRSGLMAQAGRGMLIGLLSVPLAPAVIWFCYLASS
ncbi:hypothetical protein [Mycolicibacterium sarraceniae]|uniref:Uncharacterized protein n=1 Tax=Mycolicibacterium sarraceniae TaxID=1534348 RepID=A0A7I7SLQ8_9MYCO|nr:hypothetical protein [Mycolicibacterium sarraceniae]BBY56945.1 hypothetical protein MSAR_00810 [Mycolicibacterium sarraceniae]